MSSENTPASSPAPTGDAPKSGSENISTGAAAMMMLASASKPSTPQPARKASEDTSTQTPETPTARAEQAPELTATTEETPAPETTEVAPETPPPEADPVHSQTHSFTPEQQEIFNRRLRKELAKTSAIQSQMEEAKAKLSEMEAKLNSQQAAPPPPPPVASNVPLSGFNDLASLADLKKTAKDALRYVEEVLEDPARWNTSTVVDPVTGDERDVTYHNIGDVSYTKADLISQRRQARATLEDHIPKREQFISTRVESTRQAHIQFPFLADTSSPEYKVAEAARKNPALASIMSMPQAEYILGVQIRGLRALAEDAAAAAAKTKPKAPASKPASDQVMVSSGSASAARQPAANGERGKLAAEMAKMGSKGGINSVDAQSLLLRHEQLRKSR